MCLCACVRVCVCVYVFVHGMIPVFVHQQTGSVYVCMDMYMYMLVSTIVSRFNNLRLIFLNLSFVHSCSENCLITATLDMVHK